MPYKDTEERKSYHQAYHRNWYHANKDSRRVSIGANKKRVAEWFKEYKSTLKCEHCSESHPACLDFHHLCDKKFDLCKAARSGVSIDNLKLEIAKCEVLCSNCHRKLHYDETH